MKEPTVYEFDPIIYPRKLWVSVTNNTSCLKDNFDFNCDVDNFGDTFSAIVFPCTHIKSKNHGEMVLFSSKRDMTVKNIAHESVHVTTEIFKDCNVGFSYDIGMDEHFAYLTGWAADCIHKVKTGNIQQDNILADK